MGSASKTAWSAPQMLHLQVAQSKPSEQLQVTIASMPRAMKMVQKVPKLTVHPLKSLPVGQYCLVA